MGRTPPNGDDGRPLVPATVSQLITLNRDTTLVGIIAIQEVTRHGRILSSGAAGTVIRAEDQTFLAAKAT